MIYRILVWEDGFCNFAASTAEMNECEGSSTNSYGEYQGLQPDLFFKMSHEIYNYGEGYIYIYNKEIYAKLYFLPLV